MKNAGLDQWSNGYAHVGFSQISVYSEITEIFDLGQVEEVDNEW